MTDSTTLSVDTIRVKLEERLDELKPLVEEASRIEQALVALKQPQSKENRVTSGTRAEQAVEIISKHPNITIPIIASMMGIKANYLYRVLPELEGRGIIHKTHDGGWEVTSGVRTFGG